MQYVCCVLANAGAMSTWEVDLSGLGGASHVHRAYGHATASPCPLFGPSTSGSATELFSSPRRALLEAHPYPLTFPVPYCQTYRAVLYLYATHGRTGTNPLGVLVTIERP